MKHSLKITLILLLMYLATQLIGLAVINAYTPHTEQIIVNGTLQNVSTSMQLPYNMQPPEMKPQVSLFSIISSVIFATLIILFLTRLRAASMIRAWFFIVVLISIGITLYAVLNNWFIGPVSTLAMIIAFPIAFYKIYERNIIVHNISELMVYPGIAAVFVPILNVWTTIVLLIAIALYDMYAVWKSGFMQRMAKFQIDHLKIFAGFFLPYVQSEDKIKLNKLKVQLKETPEDEKEEVTKKAKIKVNLAILGGGDVAFPLIFAGVVLRAAGLIPALIIIACATLSLFGLFMLAKKGKFYPAMPFLSTGCIIGWALGLLV